MINSNRRYEELLSSIQELHGQIRKHVRNQIKKQGEHLSDVIKYGNGDVSYRIDAHCEQIIDDWFQNNAPMEGAIVICEGLGKVVYPSWIGEDNAQWRILIDPLDGTRHIMYDNRSCWILTGIAPNLGDRTCLSDIVAAIQTEIPITLQEKGVVLTAIRNHGVGAQLFDLSTENKIADTVHIAPSNAVTLENGFAVFSNFFPGAKEIISKIEENTIAALYGQALQNGALIFTEQYISNAGQLYMMATGKYRMVADIRADLNIYQEKHGKALPLCTHPYDLSASLIAEEAGCILVTPKGHALDYPMDLDTNCSWICYANQQLYEAVHPILIGELERIND